MKLVATYKISGSEYKITINGDEPEVYEKLDKALESICQKFGDLVEEFKVSEVSEEIRLGKIIVPIATNGILHASDIKFSNDEKMDFVIKTVFGTIIGLSIGNLIDSVASKENKIIDVKNPCEKRKVDVSHLITEWSD
ncbi:MAG: VapB-like antitoxin [Saccharolobus sp.]|uniref:VapB-like antitoxin n=1 Tax=Saccharolobus shibatae TaxID=2286 RepID=A0A8F5GZ74_9CREN|nr:VapB-like antitoxin [Saccharolobus shibatae]MCH4816804.1 VapB-like antitoxin [Saccharolobus shibatae]QXJ31824.1 hypothetical protein J5U21_01475 [Saccharolobus shibatae]QXJ34845.1 hypothetical protein J5U22_01392 [Saccharolobus shibatae]